MINRPTLFAAAFLVALVGCNQGGYKPEAPKEVPKANVSTGNEADLWPLQVGNQWVYDVETTTASAKGTGSAKRELTFKVTDGNKSGDKTVATIEVLEGDKHLDRSDWQIDQGGIYQVTSGDQKAAYQPPQMLVKFPVKEGEEFTQSVRGPAPTTGTDPVDQSVKSTCRGIERVDTEEGTMEAVCIESVTTFSYKDQPYTVNATIWFVPKVGLARLVQETSTKGFAAKEIFRLKSHTAK